MNAYDIHAWSIQYRQERMAEAARRSLIERARLDRERRSGSDRVSLAWKSVVSLLGGAGFKSNPLR
jgi:hypothetical protein